MNLIDIVGPVMVGPSSSHTAGAVRIGLISRRLLGEPVAEARTLLQSMADIPFSQVLESVPVKVTTYGQK